MSLSSGILRCGRHAAQEARAMAGGARRAASCRDQIVAGPVSISPPDWICPLLAIEWWHAEGRGDLRRRATSHDISSVLSTAPHRFQPIHSRKPNGDEFYQERPNNFFNPKKITRNNCYLQPRRELGTKEDFSPSPLPPCKCLISFDFFISPFDRVPSKRILFSAIYRMILVNRPPITPYFGLISFQFLLSFSNIMTRNT